MTMTEKPLESWTEEELRALLPATRMPVSEWARRHVVVGQGPKTGPFDPDFAPQFIEPLDSFGAPHVHEVTVMMLAQGGKTLVLLLALCYAIDQDPDETMIVQPDQGMARKFCEGRVQSICDSTPAVARHKTSRKHDWNAEVLRFNTCTVRMGWAGSPASIASWPIRWLFMDEVDKYSEWSGKEASPVKLARKRTANYTNRKIGKFCTPTTPDGVINQEYERSDGRRYWVPCPECGQFQTLELEQLRVPDGMSPDEIREKRAAEYQCVSCQARLADNGRNLRQMISAGIWVPRVASLDAEGKTRPSMSEGEIREAVEAAPKSRHRGYQLSALYSPFPNVCWSEIAAEDIETADDPAARMDFENQTLGITYEPAQHAIDNTIVDGLREDRAAYSVPQSALVLTAGCDIGGPIEGPHKFEWVVRAWGPSMRSWLIAYGTVLGTFDDFLEEVLYRRWEDPLGRQHMIERCLMDDGWNTEKVKEWCRGHAPVLHPMKGFPHLAVPVFVKLEEGLEIRNVDVNACKDSLYNMMLRDPGHAGRWTVHRDICDTYRKHMASEQRVEAKRGNRGAGSRRRLVWKKKHGVGSPHYWDGEVYALAAAKDLGLHDALRTEDDWQGFQPRHSAPVDDPRVEREEDPGSDWFDDVDEDWLD